jgi:hypothetical protein
VASVILVEQETKALTVAAAVAVQPKQDKAIALVTEVMA